jgi:hypothetical protein
MCSDCKDLQQSSLSLTTTSIDCLIIFNSFCCVSVSGKWSTRMIGQQTTLLFINFIILFIYYINLITMHWVTDSPAMQENLTETSNHISPWCYIVIILPKVFAQISTWWKYDWMSKLNIITL